MLHKVDSGGGLSQVPETMLLGPEWRLSSIHEAKKYHFVFEEIKPLGFGPMLPGI